MVVVMTIVLFGLCVCVCVFFAQWWAVGSCLCLKFFGVFFPPLPWWWWWLAIGCGFLFMFFFLIGGGGWWQQVWVAEKREMLAMSMGEKRKRRRIR